MKKENNEQKRIKTSVILGGIPFKVTSEGYEAETVGDETILYFSKLKKVLTLNATCTIIWNVLADSRTSDHPLSEDDLRTLLAEKYDMPEEAKQRVTGDIYKLFADLTHERVLHMKVEGSVSESQDLAGILYAALPEGTRPIQRASQKAGSVSASVGSYLGIGSKSAGSAAVLKSEQKSDMTKG